MTWYDYFSAITGNRFMTNSNIFPLPSHNLIVDSYKSWKQSIQFSSFSSSFLVTRRSRVSTNKSVRRFFIMVQLTSILSPALCSLRVWLCQFQVYGDLWGVLSLKRLMCSARCMLFMIQGSNDMHRMLTQFVGMNSDQYLLILNA